MSSGTEGWFEGDLAEVDPDLEEEDVGLVAPVMWGWPQDDPHSYLSALCPAY
jgi:hypothetical protein